MLDLDFDALAAQTRRRQRAGRIVGAFVGLLGLAGVATILVIGVWGPSDPAIAHAQPVEPDPPSVDPHAGYAEGARRRRIWVFAGVDDAGFVRKPPPKPGEWLDHFREPGQTVGEHARTCGNRRTEARHTLHLLPYADIGPDSAALLPEIEAFAEAWFTVDAQILPTAAPPAAAWSPDREQWDADRLAEHQLAHVPDDSLGVLGLVGGDMYVDGLNFVFGLGRFTERVGVHSLLRFEGEPARLRRRAFALVAHELGHMFGLEHCVFYACIMNGINSLDESDRTPLRLCPVCREKLRHALGFEHARRYRGLADFYEAQGMADDAAFARGQAAKFESR